MSDDELELESENSFMSSFVGVLITFFSSVGDFVSGSIDPASTNSLFLVLNATFKDLTFSLKIFWSALNISD